MQMGLGVKFWGLGGVGLNIVWCYGRIWGMESQFGQDRFSTSLTEDRKDGLIGFRLCRQRGVEASVAAEIIFWDAAGGFTVQTFGEVPLEMIESLIAEAKKNVRIR
jgi:hypothetical protein